ncbi:CPBP family intramembrane metalloprotease [Lacinutrix neustonica]|uniref:CPBP family intramembrane metalloprotease n=1 Tax=Lacinutrix neustonica TaxID=2980107 RepID=A0A9E8MVL4_9FLAO|nr:CPBP family intramembrane glutamic endopeptidase [Lacinutrix neustonica]WAC01749.1 CPBP family intramembrane metalloprotease [Lacinutrix neustonica]
MKVLGILPIKKHVIQFFIGFLFIVVLSVLWIYIETLVKSVIWEQKPIDYRLIYKALMYHLKSALTEDLVFRGAILYILINRLGAKWAIFISASFFGVYHVFSYGITGGAIIPILYVITVTGFAGYVWACVFEKTKSIALGLGLHLGINLVRVCFYPSQPYGELLVKEISKVNFSEWNELYFVLIKGLFPSVVTLIFLKLLLKSYFKFFKNN